LKAGDESSTTCGTSCNGGALSITAGSATGASGTTRNGGSITIDAGTGATANGTITIGNTNSLGITIGRSGQTVSLPGAETISQLLTANGGVTIAGGQNLVLQSGAGQIQQTFTTSSAQDASAYSFTSTNSGAGTSVGGLVFTPVNNTNPSSGVNTVNVLQFAAGTNGNDADNNTNGINFASATGYKNFINTPTAVLNSS